MDQKYECKICKRKWLEQIIDEVKKETIIKVCKTCIQNTNAITTPLEELKKKYAMLKHKNTKVARNWSYQIELLEDYLKRNEGKK